LREALGVNPSAFCFKKGCCSKRGCRKRFFGGVVIVFFGRRKTFWKKFSFPRTPILSKTFHKGLIQRECQLKTSRFKTKTGNEIAILLYNYRLVQPKIVVGTAVIEIML